MEEIHVTRKPGEERFHPENLPPVPESSLDETLNRLETNCYVHVMSGSSSKRLPVASQKVGEVRQLLKGVFNIADKAAALVNGKEVGEDTVLQANDRLEFVKRAGSKGTASGGERKHVWHSNCL
jgi:sulfur carrier protein ThiS